MSEPAPTSPARQRPVRPMALAIAIAFALALFASIYAMQRNENAIVELEQALQFATPRTRSLRAEIAQRAGHRVYYYGAIATSFVGIAAALAYGTLRRAS